MTYNIRKLPKGEKKGHIMEVMMILVVIEIIRRNKKKKKKRERTEKDRNSNIFLKP